MSACADGTSWKEEVLLHDGTKLIVERSVVRKGRHEIGQKPPIGEERLDFYDNQGQNSIVLGSGDSLEGASLTLDADGTGYVVGLTNGRSLNVRLLGGVGDGWIDGGQSNDISITASLTMQLNDVANDGEWKVAA
jgi:hypothetical protein